MLEYDWSEQWLHAGDCSKCRKKKYCSTRCKAHKTYKTNMLEQVVLKTMDKHTGGIFSEIANAVIQR